MSSSKKTPLRRIYPKSNHPASKQTRQAPRPARRRFWRGLAIGTGLLAIAGISAGTGAFLAMSLASTPLLQSSLSEEEAKVFNQDSTMVGSGNLRFPKLTRPVNILVLGVKVLSSDLDNPPPEVRNLGYHALVNSFEGLTDTMVLLRFNPQSGQMVVMSIPRDTRALVRGELTKLNEANAHGGPALAAKSISDMLGGVAIDRYVRINVQGVEKLIDALGGVTVNVPTDMRYQDDSQRLYINLKQGEQTLDGDQAMQFLRFRYDELGDIGRVQRQQMLMRSVVEQTLTPSTLGRLPKILSVIQSHVDTNLSVEELLALVGYASQTDRSNVQMLMLPGDFSDPDEFELSYWLPSYGQIDQMMAQYFGFGGNTYRTTSDPDFLRIAIQDSTGDDFAVADLVDTLNQSGYRNVFIDQGWNEDLSVSRIVAQGGDLRSAETIQRFLNIGEVRVESTGSLGSDVTIQLGQDWLDQQGSEL